MDTTALFGTLNSIAVLPAELKKVMADILIEEEFPRKSILLKTGQVAQRIYFIKKGLVRAFYYKGDNEYSSWFNGENEIIISVYSFFSRRPSFETIEVLDDCILQSINWDQLQSLYQQFPEFNLIGRLITEQYYIRSEEKMIELQTLTAKQRYEKLLATYPNIIQRATLGQIASYLAVKQETLSRIRGKR
ncbi:MAG TPA: Crp/Fnr family transcriptional regulator [Mucilaginibacter sp.]